MIRLYCVGTVLLLLFVTAGCADKEQVYQGMYQGFSTLHEARMAEDPSYDSVQARDRNVPGYQEYKKDRELTLNKSAGPKNGTDTK
jgi:formaldehyde-activating enzyme involved in methanogenesis